MKCSWLDCDNEAVRHIVEIKDRKILSQKDYCDAHCVYQRPFCEPGGGITTLGAGLTGSVNRFELDYITFFDNSPADAVRLREVSGPKLFGIPVLRYETYGIVRALQEKTEKPARPFTFGAFAMILRSIDTTLDEVVIDELDTVSQCYHAILRFRQGERSAVVDIRPSDAIALAIACNAPILIADAVFARAAELGWIQPRPK